jgi:predicted esterase
MIRLLPLLFVVSLAGAASASPKAAQVVRGLLDEKVSPTEAAKAWREAGLSPEEALHSIRAHRPEAKLEPGVHEVELRDGQGRTSTAFVSVPRKAWKKGRYRVLVMLHGLGGNSRKTFELASSFAPEGTLVVGPTALKPGKNEDAEDLPRHPLVRKLATRFPNWWSYREGSFTLRALRMLATDFPIDTNRVVLLGYSMGGFGAWNLGLRFHDRFAGAAPLAGGISRQEYALGRDRHSRFLLGNARMLPLFLCHGDRDEVVPVTFDRWSAEDLRALGLPFVYEEVKNGRHVMRDQLEKGPLRKTLLRWIATRKRDAHPERVEHHAIGGYHGSAYWVSMDELTGREARVVALTRKQTIHVVAQGVSKLTLHLDPKRINPSKAVRVFVNGKRLFKGKVEPTLETVAQSYARSGDPALTYTHSLQLDLSGSLPRPSAKDWQLGLARSFK